MKKSLMRFLIVLMLFVCAISVNSQVVQLSEKSAIYGGVIKVSWSGFSGPVNVLFYKGEQFVTYANTNVSGTGSQDFVLTNEAVGGNFQFTVGADYWVKVELRSNVNVLAKSERFSVSKPVVSLSSNSVKYGNELKLMWSGFAGNVNLVFFKGNNFIVYANTDVAGSGEQRMLFTDESVNGAMKLSNGNDYYFVVELRSNTAVKAITGKFVITLSGSLKVDLSPSDAILAGAQWNIDGQEWRNSGDLINDLPIGEYNINFKYVSGWQVPASKKVTILVNQTSNLSGIYTKVQEYGSVAVEILPIDADNAGARWKLDTGNWQTSGSTLNNIATGYHTISFSDLQGWTKPDNQNIEIQANEKLNISATYTKIISDKEVNLSVPFKAQYPPGEWNLTRNCGPTSVIQIAKFKKSGIPTEQDIKDVNDWLGENLAGYKVNDYNGSNTSVSDLQFIAKSFYRFSKVEIHSIDWTVDSVVKSLQNGDPVIVAVRLNMSAIATSSNGHFMVCRGVSADRNTFFFNDPGRSLGSNRGKNVAYTRKTFQDSWKTQNNSCLVVKDKYSGSGDPIENIPLNLVADFDFEFNTISIGWDKPVSEMNIDHYKIYRNNSFLTTVEGSADEFIDETVSVYNQNCYKVTGFSTTESDFSNEACYQIQSFNTNTDRLKSDNSKLVVYWNNEDKKLYLKTEFKISKLSIMNSSGKVVMADSTPNYSSVDTSCFQSGVYVIMIKTDSGVVVEKFVVNL